MSSSSPTRPTTATPFVEMNANRYVETLAVPVPISSAADTTLTTTATTTSTTTTPGDATAPSTPLGREVRFRPSLIFTPVLASTRLVNRNHPRRSISEHDMEELNLMLQQLCLSDNEEVDDDEEADELQGIAATVATLAITEEGKEAENDDDDDLVETNENDPSVANIATAAPAQLIHPTPRRLITRRRHTTTTTSTMTLEQPQEQDALFGRVPMTMLDPRTLEMTSVLRSSRLAAAHPASTAPAPPQEPPTLLGRNPQPATDATTNKTIIGLRSSRLAKK